MMFEVVRKKGKEVCQVYSVQMIVGQSALGQPMPVVVFLIYNKDKDRWELIEAAEFVPVGVEIPEDTDLDDAVKKSGKILEMPK